MKKQLSVGDKVKLSKLGYHFHHDISHMVDSYKIADLGIREKDAENMICEILTWYYLPRARLPKV